MKLLTINDIAKLKGVPHWRLNYAVATRGVRHFGRIGLVRVWREDQVEDIMRAVQAVGDRQPLPEGVTVKPEVFA